MRIIIPFNFLSLLKKVIHFSIGTGGTHNLMLEWGYTCMRNRTIKLYIKMALHILKGPNVYH